MSSPPTSSSPTHPHTPIPNLFALAAAQPNPFTTTTTTSSSTQTPTPTQNPGMTTSNSALRALKRDRQARNKSPASGGAVWCGEEGGGPGEERGGGREERVSYTDDSYEAIERRRWAATILDCPELLMMHAQARQDTIPSTRLHFTKLLCGYEDTRKTKKAKARRSGRVGKE